MFQPVNYGIILKATRMLRKMANRKAKKAALKKWNKISD
jgi:hypothetical protein